MDWVFPSYGIEKMSDNFHFETLVIFRNTHTDTIEATQEKKFYGSLGTFIDVTYFTGIPVINAAFLKIS